MNILTSAALLDLARALVAPVIDVVLLNATETGSALEYPELMSSEDLTL